MTCTSVLFLAVEKQGGDGLILTGRWFWTTSDDESMPAGRLSETEGRIDIDADVDVDVADVDADDTDIDTVVSPLMIWLEAASMPLRCLSLQATHTKWPIGRMVPFLMWFSKEILQQVHYLLLT